jgi:alpha-mannosidase
VDARNVVLTALKWAEDGDGFIVRLIETYGEQAEVRVTLPFLDITGACLTNPVEEDMETITVRGHSVTVGVAPFGIATMRVRVQENRTPPRSYSRKQNSS